MTLDEAKKIIKSECYIALDTVMKKKINWDLILAWICIVICIIAIAICVILKIWVLCEYGDMPITEVPSWAIPWLMNGGGKR